MITTDRALFRDALPNARPADRARCRHQDDRHRFVRRGLDDRQPGHADPPHQVPEGQGGARRVIAEQQVTGIVIGLPLNLDGSEARAASRVRAFARNMEELGLPILL